MQASDWLTLAIGGPSAAAVLWSALRVLPRRFSQIEARLTLQDATLGRIEHETHMNSGSSLKDAAIRSEAKLDALTEKVDRSYEDARYQTGRLDALIEKGFTAPQ